MDPMINISMMRMFGEEIDGINITALNKDIMWGRKLYEKIQWGSPAMGGTLKKEAIIDLRDFLNEVLDENNGK